MSAVPSWAPEVFHLTNPYSGYMYFNYDDGRGLFLPRGTECSMDITVRSTKDNVPQADGSILHHRFLTGAEMSLTVELWADGAPACDEKLSDMHDLLTGSLRSLLNAGDNEGRLAWQVDGQQTRMLDDIRLLEYPRFLAGIADPVVTAKIDSQYPYAQDLLQIQTDIADGATVVINNSGTAEYWPVYQVSNVASGFTLTNATTGEEMTFTGVLAGADYAEIDSFRNTIFKNGSGADLLSNLTIPGSLFPKLRPGNNSITIVGGDVSVLWAPAWG